MPSTETARGQGALCRVDGVERGHSLDSRLLQRSRASGAFPEDLGGPAWSGGGNDGGGIGGRTPSAQRTKEAWDAGIWGFSESGLCIGAKATLRERMDELPV